MNLLVTGGAGFIGSNFVRYMVSKYPDYKIVNLDKLTYAGNLANLKDIEDSTNYFFIRGDIRDRKLINNIIRKHNISKIINFAAETHVDRSIDGPAIFIETNVGGIQVLLDAARENNLDLLFQISTDEVYGALDLFENRKFTEDTPLSPRSPYSASKAAADMLVLAYYETYGLPCVISRCSNNYGPYQHEEKFIPNSIKHALADKPIPLYGDGLYVRDWIYVLDNCRAVDLILHKGKTGEIYNIGADNEIANLEVAKNILKILGKSEDLIEFVVDRPGHDRRYAISNKKLVQELGWDPKVRFDEGLKKTVFWYKTRNSNMEALKN